MPVYRITAPNGQTYDVSAPEGATEQDVLAYAQSNYQTATDAPEPEQDSAWDFSGDRTIFGRAQEMSRGFQRSALSSLGTFAEGVEGLTDYLPARKVAEYATEKAAGFLGFGDEYEKGKEAIAAAPEQFTRWVNEDSVLKADEKYKDLWTTSLAEGAGSLLTIAAASLANPGLGWATAISQGSGQQQQAMRRAEEQGEDISEGERLYGTVFGGAVGALDMVPIGTILKPLKSIPKNIPIADKEKVVGLISRALTSEPVKAGLEEGTQEVVSSVLQNLVEMGYNPNAELPTAESLWNDFSVGAFLGTGARMLSDAAAGHRNTVMGKMELERERKAREREEANFALAGQQLRADAERRAAIETDPTVFAQEAAARQREAVNVPPPTEDEVKTFNKPSVTGAAFTPSSFGELYAYRIIGKLGKFFPTNTTFSVVQKDNGFAVVDANGNQYGQDIPDQRAANAVATNLNREVPESGIRSAILDTLKSSPQAVSEQDFEPMYRYGYRALSPETGRVTFASLNEAAGTTADKGYIENLPLDIAATAKKVRDGRYSIQMPDGSTQYISGLTAAQKLNLKRLKEGLPEATSFNIGEARDFLGGTVGKLAEPVVSGIQDRLQYGASLLDGKPVVFSEAGEVIPGRKTTDAEKLRAGMDEDGKSVLPDYIEFQNLDEAKRYAGRLNQRAPTSRYLPPEILADKTDLTDDIKRLLDAKNIASEVSSPEIGQLVKAFTGAKNFSDMTLDDQKLFYARMRELPKLSKPAKIPVFKARTYTPEQFVRAAQAQNQSGKMLSDTEIAEAAGLEPDAKGVTDIRRELKRQNGKRFVEQRREAEEVAPVQHALGKILSEYGIDPNILKVSTRLKDEEGRDITDQTEGFYDPRTKELALAIDSIDPEGKLTQEQRVNALAEVMSHEIIHALRAMDMFTQKEWALLEAAATRTQKPGKGMTYLQWARRPVEKGGYADKSPTVQVEEAIADMARDLIGNRKVIGGKPRNLLERIIQFFTKVRNLMDGYGFTTFEDLLDAIRSGEVGRREQGVVRSLRTTEAIEEKMGFLPARYRERITEFGKEPPVPTAKPAATGQTAADFDEAQLAGAQVMESRKAMPETIEVDGVQRPTVNSNGQQIHNSEQEVENFWRWATEDGNNPVTDEDGRPVVLYTGTSKDLDFKKFRIPKNGAWFTTDPEEASQYAMQNDSMTSKHDPESGWGRFARFVDVNTASRVMPVYLRAKNPTVIPEEGMQKLSDPRYAYKTAQKDYFERLKFSGSDMAVFPSGKVYVVLGNDLQIKSAIGNIGTYRTDTGDIRYSRKALPETIEVDGVQRPTMNSEGQPIFDTEEGVRNFWRWFGDSKVVDSEGSPRVLYHSTTGDFSEFEYGRRASGNMLGKGFYFGGYELAEGYSDTNVPGTNIIPAYLSIKNPFYGELTEDDVAKIKSAMPEFGPVYDKILIETSGKIPSIERVATATKNRNEFIQNALVAAGYDGRIQSYSPDSPWEDWESEYVAFNPSQIKSAIANTGAFSPESSDIRYSRKDLQGQARIPYEVAPNPDDIERTELWKEVPLKDKIKITQTIGPKAVREVSKILKISDFAFDKPITGQGLFEGMVNPNQILGMRSNLIMPEEAMQFAAALGRVLEQKGMIVADGRLKGYDTSVIRIKTKGDSKKVAERLYGVLTKELGDLGGYTAAKDYIDIFNFTSYPIEQLYDKFAEILGANVSDIDIKMSYDTVQSAYIENTTYGDYIGRTKPANKGRLEREIESARSRIIGEFQSAIDAALGRNVDGQPRVRRLAPGEGGDTGAIGRTGTAKRLEEVRGPDWLPIPKLSDAQSIPAFAQKKPRKDSVSAFVTHYSQVQGLTSLDSSFAGTGSAGREARRFGLGNYGKRFPAGSLGRRLYFYVQSKESLPKKERAVAGNSIYRARLDNLYDVYNDPRGFSDESGPNIDLFEELVSEAGYDGAIYQPQPGIDEPTVVLFGLSKKVPVRAYNEPAAGTQESPISQEDLADAVRLSRKDTEQTGRYAVPLYGAEASPEALYIAQNPEKAATPSEDDLRRYSRRNAPVVSPAAKAIMDRATPLPPEETLGQTLLKKMEFPPIADMKDRFRQGAIFRYARLERQYRENPDLMAQLADTSAIAAIELADHARAFTQRAILYGVPVYENGTTKIKDFVHNGKQYRGLLEVMGMLYSPEHGNLEQLAHAYATAVRGERLNKEGKLSPVAPGELAVLEKEVDRFVNPETGRPIIKEWFETWQAYNSNIVKYLRDTGIVDQAGADLWMKQADYIPFYREDAEGNLQFPRVFGGLHTAGQFKAVGKSDKALNVDMITAIVGNVDAAIAMGMKNVAQQRIIRDQIKLGLASVLKQGETVGQRNSVSFKIGGKRYTAIIDDPLIYESMLPASEIPLDGIIGQAVRAPAGLLRELIIRDPGYMIANMFRDTLSSYAITGAEITPVVDTVRGMFSDLTNLENMGVVGGYDLRLDDGGVRKFYDKHAREMGMVAGLDWTKPWMAIWDGMGRLSTRSEAATRLAVYNDVLARTGNEAEAQYQSLSVMNYGRRGSNPLLRALTAVVPFMNARIQGLDKLYQAARGRIGAKYDTSATGEKTRNLNNLKNFQRFFFRAALITGVTALYYAMVSDDDEYKNASPEVRDGYYIIPLKKGDVAAGEPGLSMRLPIPFEVGILFKVIPERLLATMYGEDTPRDIKQSFWRNMTSTLAINPIPQAVLPITEMMFNYDTFTGRPVVPAYMENLLPEQQQTFYTNQLAVKLAETETGQKLGISPMKLEHLLNGYGGTLGGYFLQALDSLARENEMVKPDTTWYQKPFIKRFFTTANQPGLQNQFYDLKDYTDGITRTINDLEEQGRYDELAAFYAKNGHLYEMRSTLNFLNREITALRDQRKMVEQMDIDPESKRELIEQINMQIAATLTSVPMLRQEAFGPREEE